MIFSVNIYTPNITFDRVSNAYCRMCSQEVVSSGFFVCFFACERLVHLCTGRMEQSLRDTSCGRLWACSRRERCRDVSGVEGLCFVQSRPRVRLGFSLPGSCESRGQAAGASRLAAARSIQSWDEPFKRRVKKMKVSGNTTKTLAGIWPC